MQDDIETTYLTKFNKLALAVSGGIDSMCLLHYFLQNKQVLPEFIVVNVHHNLRGNEGQSDSDFVRDYCKSHDIDCLYFDEDIPAFCKQNGYGIEQGARQRRQEIFAQLVQNNIVERVLTAHHLCDQTESVLMHIFRGSGINGLCGIPYDNGVLLRPLINVAKWKIIKYATDNNVAFVTDSSNSSSDYTRNKLRLDIIPELNKIYGDLDENVARLTSVATQIQTFVNNHCPTPIVQKSCVKIKTEWLKNQDFVSAELIARAVELLTTRVDLTADHINKIYTLSEGQNSQKLSLPFGVTAYKEYDFISFAKCTNPTSIPEINIPFALGSFDCGWWQIDISDKDNGGLMADFNTLSNCTIRTRKAGDTFNKFGGGTKSLGDFLTDKKVPTRLRDNLIVVALGTQIKSVLPYEISQQVKVTATTVKKVYLLATEK